MKYKTKFMIFFLAEFIFCLIYRFIIEGKNANNSFYSIDDFTVNTQGYLNYIHTATFYTLIFVFILGSAVLKLNNQNTVRLARESLGTKNLTISAICSVIFSVLFCIPHIIFMTINFDYTVLVEIEFFGIFALQFLAYVLYYFLTSQIMVFIYYSTLNCLLSGVITFAINAILMFAYRILKFTTPIRYTLVCTEYYTSDINISKIILNVLTLIPMVIIFIILNKITLKRRDVL